MTVRAVEGERTATPPILRGVASLAVSASLGGDPHPAEVLGAGGTAVWIGDPEGVLVVTTGGAVRLPNGLHVPAATRGALASARAGDVAVVGGGEIRIGPLVVKAVRWWDPVPALGRAHPARVAAAVACAAGRVPPEEDHGLAAALGRGDVAAAGAATRRMIGEGEGLTPRGDDVVAGTVAAFLLMGRAVGDPASARVIEHLRGPVLEHAAGATTAFSATLVACAFRGEMAAPAGVLLQALAGRGDPVRAAGDLEAVGHSSGPALAAGVLAGTRAAIERSR